MEEGRRAVMRTFDPAGAGISDQVLERLEDSVKQKILASLA